MDALKMEHIINAIYDAAQNLVEEIAGGQTVNWDMSILGPLADYAEKLLTDKGIPTCFPYWDEDETPCYKGIDCTNENCPMKGARHENHP